MTLPTWVTELIARLPETYTGPLYMNCYQGGMADLAWQGENGESRRVTAPPK